MNLPRDLKDDLALFFTHPDIPGLTEKKSYRKDFHDYQILSKPLTADTTTLLEIGPRVGQNLFLHHQEVNHYSMLELDDLYYQTVKNLMYLKGYSNSTLFHSVGFISQFHAFFKKIFITSTRYIENDEYFQQLNQLFTFISCDRLYIINFDNPAFISRAVKLADQINFVLMNDEESIDKTFLIFKKSEVEN